MLQKLIILALFFAVTLFVGFLCHKQAASLGGFILGSRNTGPWLSAFAYGTSYFSSVVFVGYAGQFGFSFGIAATWIGIGNALIGSWLAWKLLARRTRAMTHELDCSTMPDFFAKRYNCPALKTVAALLIFVFLIPYSASVYKGLSGLFAMAFGINFIWCMLGIAVLTAIYVVVGGYMAAALNDLIQGIVMIFGIAAVVFSVIQGKGGLLSAISLLEAQNPVLVTPFGPDPLGLLSVIILTSVGAWGLPQMVHKFYTIKDDQAISKATIISTLFALVIAGGSYFMGAFGRLYLPAGATPAFDSIVPTMLGQCLPDLMIGVVLVVVLSASMSTLSSLVITSSSSLAMDLFPPMESKKTLALVRILCVGFVSISVAVALIPSNVISSLMGISWGALSGCFLGPFVFGLFSKRASATGVWACFISGLVIMGSNAFFHITDPVRAGAVAVTASLIVMPLVCLLVPAPILKQAKVAPTRI